MYITYINICTQIYPFSLLRKGSTLNTGKRREVFVSRADAQERRVFHFKRRRDTLTYTRAALSSPSEEE